jgi:1-acyl-sn-glycerol-3-phosphate acyltransferase
MSNVDIFSSFGIEDVVSRPAPQRSLLSRAWYETLRWGVLMIGVMAYRVRFSGTHNIPAEGGVLVISNHQSHFDPPLVGLGCARRMNYVARDSLFGFPPFRWLIKSLDAIPIDREGIGLSGIKESLKRLKRGEMVLIFPEGTRTRDGNVGTFRPGFTTLAVRSGAAILPVAIEGAYQAWPRCHRFPRLGRVRVHYGKPMLPSEIAGRDERELLEEVHRRVCECLAIVKAQAR